MKDILEKILTAYKTDSGNIITILQDVEKAFGYIPEEAVDISYGMLLRGAGKAWMDELKFEIVDSRIPAAIDAFLRVPAASTA